jgi:hypothetical protein
MVCSLVLAPAGRPDRHECDLFFVVSIRAIVGACDTDELSRCWHSVGAMNFAGVGRAIAPSRGRR